MLFSKFSLLWNYKLSDLEEGKICNPCRGAKHMCRTHQTVLLIIPSKHETLNHCSYNVGSSTGWHIPNTRHSPNARSMLYCHLRRWTNIDQTLDELLPFARLLRLSCKSGQTYWRSSSPTHLRDFNSDKKVWIHTPQEKQANGHCLEVALDLHAGVYTVICNAKLRRILQDVLLMSEI